MIETGYKNSTWNQYARCHVSVTSSLQLELFKEAASHLQGDVADFGCGTARLIPLLIDKETVTSYTGVDYSPEMVTMAKQWATTLNLPAKPITIIEDKIENISGRFSTAVSIHSYYSWTDTEQVLFNIHRMLDKDGYFILATPNPQIDMNLLLAEAQKELYAHPDFEAFRNLNLELSKNPNAKFVTMDTIIDEARHTGFKVIECHQKHYLGFVNFLVLKK